MPEGDCLTNAFRIVGGEVKRLLNILYKMLYGKEILDIEWDDI